jgi:hypothetical protein
MRTNKKYISDFVITKVVCDVLAVDFHDLIKKNAARPLPDYRTILVLCLKKFGPPFGASTRISKILNRDHASILYLFKKGQNLVETDQDFRVKLYECLYKIENLNTMKEKSTIELLNELQDAQVITESFKIILFKAIEREKENAVEAALNTPISKRESQI